MTPENVECPTCHGKGYTSSVVKAADSFDGISYITVNSCPACSTPENVEASNG